MTLFVSGKTYSKGEWKRLLFSDKGIFKKIEIPTERYAGPHLQNIEGVDTVQGDTLGFEMAMFNFYSTEAQKQVFLDLRGQDEELAYEYLLVVSNALSKWKKDIQVMQQFLFFLRQEEKELAVEKDMVKHAEQVKFSFPEVLQRHLPEDYQMLKEDLKNMDKFLKDLDVTLAKVEILEKNVKTYLASLKSRHLGFLFL